MADWVTGVFRDRSAAERAVSDLQSLGYRQQDISVMMNDQVHAQEFAEDTGSRATEGAGVGAGIGGTLGAIVAALTATGAVVATGGAAAPLVAGPLAAALAGAGAGGLAGGLIGGLVGAGIPEDQARIYETDLNAGGILVGVEADAVNADRVRQILTSDGARNVQSQTTTAVV